MRNNLCLTSACTYFISAVLAEISATLECLSFVAPEVNVNVIVNILVFKCDV